ncbi:hypothetical protein AVEN_69581-1 [Araneus ventricosus]|uniref:Uncharacterized protein n=1 Tax=Araneus ventricosus TaxID=182803 RepID=A0A4Y2J2X3_ARAVE|nr:hypothetical protein AVEN_69581-1 [Araneus ventricosus]
MVNSEPFVPALTTYTTWRSSPGAMGEPPDDLGRLLCPLRLEVHIRSAPSRPPASLVSQHDGLAAMRGCTTNALLNPCVGRAWRPVRGNMESWGSSAFPSAHALRKSGGRSEPALVNRLVVRSFGNGEVLL